MIRRFEKYLQYICCLFRINIANIVVFVFRQDLLKEDIWLIKEKRTEARDNGYHFFKYLCEKHPEINAYYVITNDSSDLQKVNKIGKTIQADSFKHYMYYLSAKYNIGSQPYGAAPSPDSWNYKFRKLCRKDNKFVFLQHGITKADIPGLYYKKTKFDLFVCSAEREYDYLKERFGYNDSNLKLTGLCRFDNLNYPKSKKIILIMPTFRSFLTAKNREKPATDKEQEKFKESRFYFGFSNLLKNTRLKEYLSKSGFSIIFYLHYSFQSFNGCFSEFGDSNIIIADRKQYDVQKLLLDSSILVTDFSSVFFDFAYMMKPEVFFQPDADEFLSHHYAEGYFDYSLDGFGPVFSDVEMTVNYITRIIDNGCLMEDEYKKRVNAFFTLRDNHNCERTFNAIKELD